MRRIKMSQNKKLTVALLQLPVVNDVAQNVENAIKAITEVKQQNPNLRLAILPESFNAPYGIEYFSKYAETIPNGFTSQQLSKLANTLNIYIIGGSIIECVKPNELYNTCTVWSPTGKLIGRHRKVHLFHVDIDIENEGGAFFNEAIALTAGKELTVVDIDGYKVGLGICHDKRFEEMARAYRNLGCVLLIYPSAFCICQGPLHWELLQRARATDNQVFVITCAPARDNRANGYIAYGHSMIVNPWGQVQCEAGATRQVLVEEIDFKLVDDVRRQIPIFDQRRLDIYQTQLLKKCDSS